MEARLSSRGWKTIAATGLMVAAACRGHQTGPPPAAVGSEPLRSRLVHSDEGALKEEVWGHWRSRLRGDTHGVSKMALSLFTLAPGQAPHPPHRHAEEELMILVEGAGTWHLNGTESPAHQGDVVYAAPWDMHGLRNTADRPLSYYVLKWNARTPP
jgi:quercetin dioxygenase-like cupin family protein